MFFKKPIISVCIPVYGTEKFLESCLVSVAGQRVPDGVKNFFEIVVVEDSQRELASGEKSATQIIKEFSKKYRFRVNHIIHNKNKGILEVRRTLVYEAKGEYIVMVDSDDVLEKDALLKLYQKAQETQADIVQGRANVVWADEKAFKDAAVFENFEKYRTAKEAKANKFSSNELKGREILDDFLLKNNHSEILWAKIFTRELYLAAFNHIPPAFCVLADDFLQYFWLAYEAKKYVSIQDVVYRYTIDVGISSSQKVENLDRWKRMCSNATVFPAIFSEIQVMQEDAFSDEEKEQLALRCRTQLAAEIQKFEKDVASEIKSEAYKILCEYWGAGFVESVQKDLEALAAKGLTLTDAINL